MDTDKMKNQQESLTDNYEIYATNLLAKAIQHMPDEEIGWIDQGCYLLTVHLPSNHSYNTLGYTVDEIPNFQQLIYRKIRQVFGFYNEKLGTQVGMISAGDLRGTRTGYVEYSMQSYHLHALIILPVSYRSKYAESEEQLISKIQDSILGIKEIELHYRSYFPNDQPHLVPVTGSEKSITHVIDYIYKSSKKHISSHGEQLDINILPYQYLITKKSKQEKIDRRVLKLTISLHLRKKEHFTFFVNKTYRAFQHSLMDLIKSSTPKTEAGVKNRVISKLL